MDNAPPDQLLLSWLNALPQRHREALAHRYVFMTSNDTADFCLSGGDAWRYFEKRLLEPDFPLRRVARLLIARDLLNFILACSSSDVLQTLLSDETVNLLPSLDNAQFLRAGQHLRELCQAGLSDAALEDWLLALQG